MAPKAIGLDLEKMRVTLRKLAQFHASSAIYYETHGHFDEKYSRGVYNAEMASIFDQHYDYNFTFILDEFFSTWPNLDIKIIDKMVSAIIDLCIYYHAYNVFFLSPNYVWREIGANSF